MWANLQKDEKCFDFNLRSNRVEHSSSLVILPSLYFINVWFSVNPSDNNSSAHIKVTFFRVYGIGRDFIKIGFLVFFPPSVLVRLSVTLFTWSICRFTELGNGGQNKRTNDCSSGKLHYVSDFSVQMILKSIDVYGRAKSHEDNLSNRSRFNPMVSKDNNNMHLLVQQTLLVFVTVSSSTLHMEVWA